MNAALAVIAESIGTSDESLRLIIGILGMGLLATSFTKSNEAWTGPIAGSGWVFLGLFIYLLSEYYVKIGDPLLVIMTAGALPAGYFSSLARN